MTDATVAKIPHVLVIMDGIGHREAIKDNAFLAAKTPSLSMMKQKHPHSLISGSGEDVGLPDGQMGNSEVGHMNLGAGRVLYQDFTRITKDIRDGVFFEHEVLVDAVEKAKAVHGAVHIMGLLSEGGVHSHEDHIVAMCELALKRGATVYLHAFLDGRDTPPKSAQPSLEKLDALFAQYPEQGRIVSMIGRYFAMDRDNRWDRVEQAYRLLTESEAVRTAQSAVQGLELAYAAGESDEFVKATRIGDAVAVQDGDSIVFMNFRADRARELTRAFVEHDFSGFTRQRIPHLSKFVMLTRYQATIDAPVAYMPEALHNSIGEYLSNLGKTQLRIAETEKYAHVTFFFSGGREDEYPGEKRILIPSPNVATYDLKPEMSAYEVTDQLVNAIDSGEFDLLVVNYANGDMVGHTGIFDAAVKAVEAVDTCLGRVYQAVMAKHGHMIITADHGNVEQMQDYQSGQVHTQHTTELVPFIYVGPTQAVIAEGGVLADVAPTLLNLMQLPVPAEMQGRNLITLSS
ncbi:2,3-bisphosphoglycerate-independent phosphoglycerate mutase [Acinetobacter baylyi]|uniref:2,3-bisphosphoglycerate-independent phosphoglycerate mutase n=1 Tax=Acinetobacter baylyi (strain ATCC 33305 / BD413 / ADP1) TaxID=62977 RepID=GPMI_ACIAD|nr:2,3-bisphosphoglycerate-independent phosphoglycerate mutase [Acinetobacter baylyi]Q6FFD5.1 RecName: Full=2,3-bisphosphoglycerate-independent phosphoglycerate mutase; Short=BPG-independent PGAM; Short=Phosphoglyceromutase; Short=iPGM [Acinetobacter baylyi ADP1]ENV52909.1 2,3-bisphosphoglycerate-independent phosphoglycerate mutase [Acinetobacter baylyi DSM 14961 = CIP 107474]KAF2369414.1 phosphoglycerate mutase (2,3-diphosphoglycerate-independent) [Acinetobacter baylyi]KAF2373720.1 phosphoglyc